MKLKKSQGEIFGVALMFVIIILGIVIYGKYSALDPNNHKNPLLEKRYKILSESTLNTILKKSTNCYPERNKDSVTDLIKFCVENSIGNNQPSISCEGSVGFQANSCDYAIEVLNQTLINLYNNSNNKFHIPYVLNIYLEENISSPLRSVTISNFGSVKLANQLITFSNHRKLVNKAPSGLYSIPSSKRQIKFDFSLYYK